METLMRYLCKLFGHRRPRLVVDATAPRSAWYDAYVITKSHRECSRCGTHLSAVTG